MNMRIAKLHMDAQDRTRFEIHGKSSVKYTLKANHSVEAKRWFWALNNAIQWTKDEAKAEVKADGPRKLDTESPRSSKIGDWTKGHQVSDSTDLSGTGESHRSSTKNLAPAPTAGLPSHSLNSSWVSLKPPATGPSSVGGDDFSSIQEQSVTAADFGRLPIAAHPSAGGAGEEEDDYGDDTSSREVNLRPKDAFNITAHSAGLQLDLLAQVSKALGAQLHSHPQTPLSHPAVTQAISTYEEAVTSLQSMVGDLLKISRDRDAYWQYRVDREADMRRLWEDSMAKVAKEQEMLEGRIGESEDKRKRTKRALREALEDTQSRPGSPAISAPTVPMIEGALKTVTIAEDGTSRSRRKSMGIMDGSKRRSTIAALTDLSDSDSGEDEEFFDAVGAGAVEVVPVLPTSPLIPDPFADLTPPGDAQGKDKASALASSFLGYEDGPRRRLEMDADDRPKISLWVGEGRDRRAMG